MNTNLKRSWLSIDCKALCHNLEVLFKKVQKPVWCIVKADAYGHGAQKVVETLTTHKACKGFGVAQVSEAFDIQPFTDKPILILGPTLDFEKKIIVSQGWIGTVSNVKEAETFYTYGKAKVYLFLDTGMGRAGLIINEDTDNQVKACLDIKLDWKGLMSHLSEGDDETIFKRQKELFDTVIERIHRLDDGDVLPDRHIHNSCSLENDLSHCTSIRSGLSLYGCGPDKALKPVASLKARITFIKKVPKGYPISYNSTYICDKETKVGIVGLGYADGWLRSLRKKVYCQGELLDIIGNITMDQTMIKVTNQKEGDVVEFFGEHLSLLEQCQGFIPYEVLTTCGKVRGGRVFT